mgnify:CR=1 FL=1
MADFTEFGIEVEKHLSKLGKDIQQFVEKVVPLTNEDKDFAPDCDIVESESDVLLSDGEEFKRQERKRGAFARSFALPETVNKAEIDASFRNGVLTVAMPKSESLKNSQSIPVK